MAPVLCYTRRNDLFKQRTGDNCRARIIVHLILLAVECSPLWLLLKLRLATLAAPYSSMGSPSVLPVYVFTWRPSITSGVNYLLCPVTCSWLGYSFLPSLQPLLKQQQQAPVREARHLSLPVRVCRAWQRNISHYRYIDIPAYDSMVVSPVFPLLLLLMCNRSSGNTCSPHHPENTWHSVQYFAAAFCYLSRAYTRFPYYYNVSLP